MFIDIEAIKKNFQENNNMNLYTALQREALDKFWVEVARISPIFERMEKAASYMGRDRSETAYMAIEGVKQRLQEFTNYFPGFDIGARTDAIREFLTHDYVLECFKDYPFELMLKDGELETKENYIDAINRIAAIYLADRSQDTIKVVEQITSQKKVIDELVATARRDLNLLASDSNRVVFSRQAAEGRRLAKVWLVGTAFSVSTGIGIGLYKLAYPYQLTGGFADVESLLPSLLVLSFVVFAVRFCARNYKEYLERAHDDQATTNAFASLDLFVGSISNESQKDQTRVEVVKDLLLRRYQVDRNENPAQSLLNLNLWKKDANTG